MAVLSLIELLKLAQNPVEAGVIEHIITVDQLTAILPMVSLGVRDSLTYRREKALPGVSKVASGGTITADNALVRIDSETRRASAPMVPRTGPRRTAAASQSLTTLPRVVQPYPSRSPKRLP